MKPNGNISTEWAKVFFFVWEKELFRREIICFLINFLETFSNFKSNRLNNATVYETPMLKKYLNSRKSYFLVRQFIENQVFKISALFLCFSVFSLFKLISLSV